MSHTPLSNLFHSALIAGKLFSRDGAFSESELERVKSKLFAIGLKPREGVGFSLANSIDCLLHYMALADLNAVAIPLPVTTPEEEQNRLWNRLGVRVAITEKGVAKLSQSKMPFWPENIHWVMHSSGSTGIPKAIPLTLECMQKNSVDVMDLLNLGKNLKHMGVMSQCYTAGLYNAFMLPLLTGGSVVSGPVVTALGFQAFKNLLLQTRPDVVWVNPTVCSFMTDRLEKTDVSFVKAFLSCTAPLTAELARRAEGKLGKPVLQSYGLTETLITSMEKPGRDSLRHFSSGEIVGGAKSVSLDDENCVVIQNGAVFPGYAENINGSIKLGLENGHPGEKFITGDVGQMIDGRLSIVGRVTNMLSVGGVKLSCEQMEDLIKTEFGLEQVAVGGFEDAQKNEGPVVVVAESQNVDDEKIKKVLVEKLGVAARPIRVLKVQSLPKTASGKIDRPAMKSVIRSKMLA